MVQATLTAANLLQSKVGTRNVAATPDTAAIGFDAGCQQDSTVIILLADPGGGGMMSGGMGGSVPDGFEYDGGVATTANLINIYAFRQRYVTAGQQSWNFTKVPPNWFWWATEWDLGLEPVSPLEALAGNSASGTAPTSVSTGTTPTTSRANVVAMAIHHWTRTSATGATFDWSGHTNGFVEQDQVRWTMDSGGGACGSVSMAYATATGAFECSATINLTPRDASDVYFAMVAVYAATTYA